MASAPAPVSAEVARNIKNTVVLPAPTKVQEYDALLDKLQVQRQEQLQAEEAAKIQRDAEAAEAAKQAAILAAQVHTVAVQAATLTSSYEGSLTGSYGYASPFGNCVNEPGVNNPGWGNPIDWPVLSTVPTLGATFLFYSNHTGVVTGIWSNGDLEVRHQNYVGGQHRFPRSMFRGFR